MSARRKLLLAVMLGAAVISSDSSGQIPFSRGVNLTGWFQASSPREVQFSKFTRVDFENIKRLGFDVVRLPINLHAMTSGEPDYTPDPLFLDFLDQVVDWTEELGIHLILDNHTFDPAANTDPAVEAILVKVWTQMARHFSARSEYLYYEILNEPHGIEDAVWNDIQLHVIDAIRTEDTKHFIVVGPANWNSYHNLEKLPHYSDARLIYTFHFYDPFVFTHQGASWVDPSMVPLAGVPFPYIATRMPETPASLKGSWIEGALANYANEGTAARVKQLIDIAAAFRNSRDVPLFCGEFGVYKPNSPDEDRADWYQLVRSYFDEKAIPWTMWDYRGSFGLFEKNSPEYFDYDLNVRLLEALNLEVPPQQDYIRRPLRRGFTIYGDDIGADIVNTSASGNGVLDFYSTETPQEGDHCIYWTGVGQYDAMSFDFMRDPDLSLLKENDHTLEFYVRGNAAAAMFDVRFTDTKKDASDRPWRKGMTISGIPEDNQWHLIQIKLEDLEEKGAWDGAWFPPDANNFDWKSVDRFEIVPEYQPLDGIVLEFDHIRVVGEDVTVSTKDAVGRRQLISVYPNPAREKTLVEFIAEKPGPVQISVYDPWGKKIRVLFQASVVPGTYVVSWDETGMNTVPLSAGMYVVSMQSPTGYQVVRVSVAD